MPDETNISVSVTKANLVIEKVELFLSSPENVIPKLWVSFADVLIIVFNMSILRCRLYNLYFQPKVYNSNYSLKRYLEPKENFCECHGYLGYHPFFRPYSHHHKPGILVRK